MIGILGGMGTQAGLDFCNKLAVLNRGKTDQKYPLFILYNKSNIPKRPENLKKYYNVLKSLVAGCNLLKKNKCKFYNKKYLNRYFSMLFYLGAFILFLLTIFTGFFENYNEFGLGRDCFINGGCICWYYIVCFYFIWLKK